MRRKKLIVHILKCRQRFVVLFECCLALNHPVQNQLDRNLNMLVGILHLPIRSVFLRILMVVNSRLPWITMVCEDDWTVRVALTLADIY